MVIIRNERETDFRTVEEITRRAFYNLYIPGCVEHYLVHIMRQHPDFIPQLDFVAELDGRVIGNIMYTKATLSGDSGQKKEILTFEPVCIQPEYQRKGYGKQLMEYSFEQAGKLSYDTIVIFGNPGNYVSRGFKSCCKYNVSLEDGSYPSAMLVKELVPGVLNGTHWIYRDSPVMQVNQEAALHFDKTFEPLERCVQPSQEEFYIHSHSVIQKPE